MNKPEIEGSCCRVLMACICLLFSDETAVNCRRFIDGGGMDLFLRCLEVSQI